MVYGGFHRCQIGRTTIDGTMTEFPIANGQEPEGITEGADGNLWFTEPGANAIGRITPQGESTIFQITGSDPGSAQIRSGRTVTFGTPSSTMATSVT